MNYTCTKKLWISVVNKVINKWVYSSTKCTDKTWINELSNTLFKDHSKWIPFVQLQLNTLLTIYIVFYIN